MTRAATGRCSRVAAPPTHSTPRTRAGSGSCRSQGPACTSRGRHMGTRLASKTALVTGASGNIGRAIAVAFAGEGAHVIVSGRNTHRGAEVVDEIRRAGGRAEFVAADLDGSPEASRELAAEATRILGGHIDVLVNNAGIFPGTTTASTDEATFDRVYGVNVKAPFF